MHERALKSRRARRTLPSGNGQPPIETTVPEVTELASSEASAGATQQAPHGPQPLKPAAANEILGNLRTAISSDNLFAKRSEVCALVSQLLITVMAPFDAAEKYNWLIIHDTTRMIRGDTDRIYAAINKFKDKKEIGLIIISVGGQIEPAYLISKLCRESTTGKFVAVVPRRAKSGATLICCGADEIHMGQMSELGPIDPQFDELPALGLKNAVEHVAELASKYPNASEMFASYLAKSLDLVNLGYYERVAESAMQYAEKLLQKRLLRLKGKPGDVARQLVYGYKDHGFVIDQTEAVAIFGDEMIQGGTQEYALGNSVYEWLSAVVRAFESAKCRFYMYGSVESECGFFRQQE